MAHRKRLTLGKFTNILYNTEFELIFSLFFCVYVEKKIQTLSKWNNETYRRKNPYFQYDEVHGYSPKNDRLFSAFLSSCIMTAANFIKI